MNTKIRVAILGYGNLGQGVEMSLEKNSDMELVGIFSRRDPKTVKSIFGKAPIYSIEDLLKQKDSIDVLILAGGSKDDLPVQGPKYAADFHIVDSFDTHPKIPEYFAAVDKAAKAGNKVALISIGWDPGMFSLNRLFAEVLIPDGDTYTFWGKGLSQGHSDAIRHVEGVLKGVQYTIPSTSAMDAVRRGERPQLTTRQKHTRECFIVAKDGADTKKLTETIKTMPAYFADYDTTVNFINEEEFQKNHTKMPHGGFVIRSGNSSKENKQMVEYSIKLDSNAEFTAGVLVAYARAAFRLSKISDFGAKTIFDIAPALLSQKSNEELRKELL